MNTAFAFRLYTPETVGDHIAPTHGAYRWMIEGPNVVAVHAVHGGGYAIVRDPVEIARLLTIGAFATTGRSSAPLAATVAVNAPEPAREPAPEPTAEPAAEPAAEPEPAPLAEPTAPHPLADLLARITAAERDGDIKALRALQRELIELNEAQEVTEVATPRTAADDAFDAIEREMTRRG